MQSRAQELITKLNLQKHPEGGYFSEVFRSPLQQSGFGSAGGAQRSASTSIYFLLPAGEKSLWHKVVHDEHWFLLEGEGVELWHIHPNDELTVHTLSAQHINWQHTICANDWQAARPCGDYALVACVVAPGFDFADFTMPAEIDREYFHDVAETNQRDVLQFFPEYS